MIYPIRTPGGADEKDYEDRLRRTDVAQPAIGAVSLAMLAVLERFELPYAAVAGHSFGEISALFAANAIDRQTFAELSRERGRCMAAAGENPAGAGAMMAIQAPLADIEAMIDAAGADVVLANRNSPDQGVVSGPAAGIDRIADRCSEKGLRAVRLPVGAAFHSPLVAASFEPFLDVLAHTTISSPAIPVYANLSGKCYPDAPDECRKILGRQLISPVKFDELIRTMADDGVATFVEVGPKRVLSGLVPRILDGRRHKAMAMDAGSGAKTAMRDLAHLLAELAADGHAVNLTRWDPVAAPARRQKMSVPISGANVRAPGSKMSERPHPSPTTPVKATTAEPTAAQNEERGDGLPPIDNPSKESPRHMKPVDHFPHQRSAADPVQASPALSDAMSAVQEGIRALQALQLKTAETHQKFLETQAEAGKTLRRMMAGIQHAVDSPAPDISPMRASEPATRPHSDPQPVSDPDTPAPATAPTPPATTATTATTATGPIAPVSDPVKPDAALSDTLFEVVASLTGYPVETLSLDMALESDLGIDSIKRVEILSAMEERLPQLPSVVPEEMAHLKSLGDIAAYLDAEAGHSPALPPQAPDAPHTEPHASGNAIGAALIDVVSTLTGYPHDMLSLDMHLERDLGIDSIKRVEILSEMETRMPGLPGVHPEEMAALGTLGEILGYLEEGHPTPEMPAAPVQAFEPAPEPPAAPGKASTDSLLGVLVDVISQLTGYPSETLSADMNLESDLGIDSIKRVEILSAVEERVPNLPTVSPDEMSGLRTIGDIAAYLGHAPAPQETDVPLPTAADTAAGAAISRQVLQAVVTPFTPGPAVVLPQDAAVWIAHDDTPMAEALAAAFSNHGVAAITLPLADLVNQAHSVSDAPPPSGLLLVAGGNSSRQSDDLHLQDLVDAFRAIQSVAPHFTDRQESHRFIASVTLLDGRFGLGDAPLRRPAVGGLAGLVKTVRLEWPGTRCSAFDVNPAMAAEDAAARVVQELLQPDTAMPLEIGVDADTRWTLQTVPSPIQGDPAPLIEDGDVVVVTGGARGITAEICKALARAYRPTLVLLGRSPAPEPEPEWLKGLSGEAAVKKALLAAVFDGNALPKTLESAYRQHMANREISRTLAAVAAEGAQVVYRCVDVRDRGALEQILDETRSVFGPIRAVIHGAGVLEDRRIQDKTPEQVRRVLETKIIGLHHLDALTAEDPLRTLVVFSSVAARYGNIGQSDYAMANEALNKMAAAIARQRAGCRVAAVNWGPWAGGMVTPALAQSFTRRGIALIPLAEGAACLVDEMAAANDNGGEILYGSAIAEGDVPAAAKDTDKLPATARRLKEVTCQDVDVDSHPILRDHILGGKPVVPFALITEWLGHSALHHSPGLVLAALEDVRLFHGVKIDHGAKKIRLMAGKIRKCGRDYCVDVEIRNGRSDRGTDLIHASALAVLSDRFPTPPAAANLPGIAGAGTESAPADLYTRLLFHGKALHGIQTVSALNNTGMVAQLAAAPKPSAWIAAPIRSRWIGDPLVMDAAFQMAIVWCRQFRDTPCLPGYLGEYQLFSDRFPAYGVTATLAVDAVTRRKFKAAFTFQDARSGSVLARIEGFEATMDASLVKAFEASAA
jgi:malonyl CoA-acyl carrier protein transacylase